MLFELKSFPFAVPFWKTNISSLPVGRAWRHTNIVCWWDGRLRRSICDCLWVWLPDNEANTFNKCAIVAAIHANERVTCRDAEVLPPNILLLHREVVEFVPKLIDQEVARLIHETEALNIATLAVLTDVDVWNAALRIDVVPLVVLLSRFTRSNVRARNLVSEVQAKTVKIWWGTKLNTSKCYLLWQVVLVEHTQWWPFELVLVDWTKCLHLLERRHPKILTWPINYTSCVCRNGWSDHRLSTILECFTPVTKSFPISTDRLWLLETLLHLLV